MKRIVTILLALFLLSLSVSAQWAEERAVLGGLRSGVGYGLYRDMGASPLTYRGPELLPGLRVVVLRPHWRYGAQLDLSLGGYGYQVGIDHLQAYGGQLSMGFGLLRRIMSEGRWQLWTGVSLDDRADLRYNSTLDNANVGAGNFINVNLLGRAELRLGRWLLHGQLDFTPVSVVLRPGFAYMDNYDHEISNPLADFMGHYHSYVAGATRVATDLGTTLLLTNGNYVGLSYRWHYMTSHTSADPLSAPYLFEQAGHGLILELGFKL